MAGGNGAEVEGPLLARTLVGRERELAVLRDAWVHPGRVVLVRGPAGVGKSRLVREVATWSRGQGAVVLVGRCSSTSGDTPLRPFREALLAAARAGVRPGAELAPFVPALARVVPEWSGAEAVTADSSPLILGEALLRLLSSVAPSCPATLVLEDLQWADPETLAVLEYLADGLEGHPVLVVGTVRDGEPGPGSDLAAALVARRAAADLPLRALTGDEVAAMASAILGRDLAPDALSILMERAEGVPFLVEELLAAAAAGGWATISAAVPGSVAASVNVRLSGLPDAARRLLCHAAVLGRHFDWIVAARAADVAADQAPELLRLAVRAQLVDVEGSGFRFHHALTRDAVLAATGPAERAIAAARALEALEALHPALSGELVEVAAGLAAEAGLPARAAALLLDAARRALREGSLSSAEALAVRAREVPGGGGEDDADDVLLRAWTLAGRTEDAASAGARLLAARADPADRADLHIVLARVAVATGRWDAADVHVDGARSLADDAARTARVAALAAQAAMGHDDPDVAVRHAVAALDGARATGQVDVQCEALEVLGRVERGRDMAAAEAAFTEALEIATAAGLAVWRVRALHELGTIEMFDTASSGRLEEARRAALDIGALATVALVDLQLAAVHDETGDLDLALAAARRSEEASRRWGLATLPMSIAIQAAVHARAGRVAEMQAAIDAALATGQDRSYVELTVLGNATAVLHLVQADLPAAVDALDRAMEAVRRHPGPASPVPGLWALVRTLCDEAGDEARPEVRRLAVDTPVSRFLVGAADAVALGRSGDRAGAAEAFAAADAALARIQGGFRQAFTRVLVAPAALADGWGDPVAWLRESLAVFDAKDLTALAARCRGVLRDAGEPVPRRARGGRDGVPPALAALGITAREADVLALVATGLTNREAAERLVISLRTVDKHVERLLAKAGTTRAGLARLARDAGLTT